MNKGIVFSGSIFIILFVVLQIAFISTLGIDANLNLDRMIAIFSGFFSLFGGVIGATGAYFIAREQIRKQDSMRKKDLLAMKLEEIISQMQVITESMENVQKRMDYICKKVEEIHKLDLLELFSQELKIINNSISEISKLKIYLKYVGLENEFTLKTAVVTNLFKLVVNTKEEFIELTKEFEADLKEIKEFNKNIELKLEDSIWN